MSSEEVQFTGSIPSELVGSITYVVADDMHTDNLSGQILTVCYGKDIILISYQAMKVSEFIKTNDTLENVVYSDKVTMNTCVSHYDSEFIEIANSRKSGSCSEMVDDANFKDVVTMHGLYSIYPALAYLTNPDMVYDKLTIQSAITALFITRIECDNTTGMDDTLLKYRHIELKNKSAMRKSAMS